jgi:hypothetical protein
MRTRTIVVSTIYYIGVLALLLGVLFKEWVKVLPKHLAGQIGHNSEGYLAALVIAVWIQFVRSRLANTRAEWPVTIVVALVFVGLTVEMLTGDWASRFKTLNEATAAIAVLIPYVQLRRPLPSRVAAIAAAVVIVVTIATIKTAMTIDLAETFGMVIFAIVGLDLIDLGILDNTARTSAAKRWGWYAFLVIAPIVFSFLEYHWGTNWKGVGTTGIIGVAVRWLVRIVESFIFAAFISWFFAIGLGRTGTTDAPAQAVEASKPNVPAEPVTV